MNTLDVEKIKKLISSKKPELDSLSVEITYHDGIDEAALAEWENYYKIKIPGDYREWLKYSGKTLFPVAEMEFYPPTEFMIINGYVVFGKFLGKSLMFRISDSKIVRFVKEEPYDETLYWMVGYWERNFNRISSLNKIMDELKPVIEKETIYMNELFNKASQPHGGVKEAFEYFLTGLCVASLKYDGSYPKCPMKDEFKKSELIVAPPSRSLWYPWKYKEITEKIDFDFVESKLGFKVNNDIKEYCSSFYYFSIEGSGKASRKIFDFHSYGVYPSTNLENMIIDKFYKGYGGSYKKFTEGQYFCFGSGQISGDDSYIYEVDNITGEIFAVEYGDQTCIKVAESIKDFYMNLKPLWAE